MSENQLDNIALWKHLCNKEINLTSTEKLVALILASHRNNLSMMCCPGLTLLEQETKFKRRTVQRAIKSLIEKKELVNRIFWSHVGVGLDLFRLGSAGKDSLK